MIVPKLRFSEFKDEWIESKIGENFNVTSGTTPLRSEQSYFANPSIYWVKTTDLNNGIIKSTEEKISEIALAKTSLKILPKNTVFVAMYGGFNQIGRTGLLSVEATCNQALSAIYPNENFNPYFVLTYLNHKVDDWKNFAASSRKDPNITKNDVLSFPIIYPNLEEQTKIAEFLSAVDDKISQLSRQLELLNQYKKGVMQKIFSQEIRFKNDNGEDFGVWKTKFIKDLRLYISDGNYGELYPTSSQFVKQGIAFIRANNIKHLKIVDDDMRFIDRELHKILTSGHLKEDDILVTTRGDIGTLAIVENNYVGANINAQICLLRVIDTNQIYARYLLYFLASSFGQKQFKELETGTALKQLPKKNLDKILVNLPCIEEQKKIAEFLTAIDERIDHTTAQLPYTKQWKKGLLQQMFV